MKGPAMVICMLAALVVIIAGVNMIGIRSQASVSGGGTIMEVYYQTMGWALIGVGVFLFGAGLGIGGIIETIEGKGRMGNCPTCGRRISNQDAVCSFCGTKRLTRGEKPKPVPADEKLLHQPPAYCSNCGQRKSSPDAVCSHCGPTRLTVTCPSCSKEFSIESSRLGLLVECPHCKENVRVK